METAPDYSVRKESMAKSLLKILRILLIVLLLIVAVNVLEPLFRKGPDPDYAEEIARMEFEAEGPGGESILCIDDNEEALLCRLRMIGSAERSVVLSTFDLRPDDSGTDVIAALYHAAQRGVQVRILIDGVYQLLYLDGSELFQAFASHENVEVRIYNPVSLENIFRLNYRMHDKYLIIDGEMYLLGGRNTNDIFLGDKKQGINIDRDILVRSVPGEKGESLAALEDYFQEIWEEDCVKGKKITHGKDFYTDQYEILESRYAALKEKYGDMETYDDWQEAVYPADKITLLTNGTPAQKRSPLMLQAIAYLAGEGEDILIQTPYAICDDYMYDVLRDIADRAQVQIVLNAVERGSNPWGCTDYLNQKDRILDTGVEVFELMNEYAVHTKTVLIDDNLSIVGSYNLDIRSTYLDTELMLVIDSPELNSHIREIESAYMEKSKKVLSDGQETEGSLYRNIPFDREKEMLYGILRVLIRPIRHLL